MQITNPRPAFTPKNNTGKPGKSFSVMEGVARSLATDLEISFALICYFEESLINCVMD